MNYELKTMAKIVALAFCMQAGLALAQTAPATGTGTTQSLAAGVSRVTSPPVSKMAGQSRRAGMDPVDDRVEIREYGFKETNENLPYAVFVSSKVTKDKKAPMVLALHGYLGNYGTFMRTACIDAAEKGGYILVGVMGYSPTAPFGNTNMFGGRGGPGRGGPATGAAPAPAPASRPDGAPAPAPGDTGDTNAGDRGGIPGRIGGAPKAAFSGFGGRGPAIGGTKETDPAKVSELSEKDTMTVLEMVRKEFNIDDNRIFLMGHSMGGAGALYLGEKYAPLWAAVAVLAGFGSPDPKGKMKDTPLYITAGSLDNLGSGGRALAERLKAGGMDSEWKEMPGLDHGGIIAGAMPDVFKFFDEHTKPEKK
jgi:pimeloyl-ACP methyl ester carboxylesterase